MLPLQCSLSCMQVNKSVIWFKVVLIVVSISQLGLAASPDCDGVAGVFTGVLKQAVITNSGNEMCVTQEELNSTIGETSCCCCRGSYYKHYYLVHMSTANFPHHDPVSSWKYPQLPCCCLLGNSEPQPLCSFWLLLVEGHRCIFFSHVRTVT